MSYSSGLGEHLQVRNVKSNDYVKVRAKKDNLMALYLIELIEEQQDQPDKVSYYRLYGLRQEHRLLTEPYIYNYHDRKSSRLILFAYYKQFVTICV